ncbi:hypothetical protein [Nitratireductor rhodophyticola]
METLRDFIDRRRAEIKAQISSLKSELKELSTAESALKSGAPLNENQSKSSSSKNTIKEMVAHVLDDVPGGAEATEIVELIGNRFGEEVPRSSLSPQLSRMKEDGVLVLDGRTWRLSKFSRDLAVGAAGSPDEKGGGEVRGQAFPTESPEDANPSTSTEHHSEQSWQNSDDDIPF